MAVQNIQKADYAAVRLARDPRRQAPAFDGRTFNEFVLDLAQGRRRPSTPRFRRRASSAGLPLAAFYPELKNALLVCVTEVHTKEEIDRLAAALEEVLR